MAILTCAQHDATPDFLGLAAEPYAKFQRGTKRWEVRNDGPTWSARRLREGRLVRITHQYCPPTTLLFRYGRVVRANRLSDVPAEIVTEADLSEASKRGDSPFFNPNEPVVLIEVVPATSLACSCILDAGGLAP